MKTLIISILVAIASILSLIIIEYTEINAWVYFERLGGVNVSTDDFIWQRVREYQSLSKSTFYLLLICIAPPIAVLLMHKITFGQYVVLLLAVLLLILDIYIMLSRPGGDIRGCEACGGSLIIHILFSMAMFTFALAAGTLRIALSPNVNTEKG